MRLSFVIGRRRQNNNKAVGMAPRFEEAPSVGASARPPFKAVPTLSFPGVFAMADEQIDIQHFISPNTGLIGRWQFLTGHENKLFLEAPATGIPLRTTTNQSVLLLLWWKHQRTSDQRVSSPGQSHTGHAEQR